MSHEPDELDGFIDHDAEARDTIIKSGLGGVALTVFAVVACSPAGLGGMIGTSVAGLGWSSLDPDNTGKDTVTFPTATPLTSTDLATIRERLANTAAEIDNVKAATDGEIEFMRGIAAGDNVLAFSGLTTTAAPEHRAPVTEVAERDRDLELAELLLPMTEG